MSAAGADRSRNNIATATRAERDRFRDAIIALHKNCFIPGDSGTRASTPPGGVSCWFKQDEIHAGSHVHNSPAFLPWHRELLNRFEDLLVQMKPSSQLYYWDWTTDPHDLFKPEFMGSANGDAGEPWLSAKFYDPTAIPFRSDDEFDPHNNPFDPPSRITREVQITKNADGIAAPVTRAQEEALLAAATFEEFDRLMSPLHANAHFWIGGRDGTLADPHKSFRDPFVFLLHANIDRLYAIWQSQAAWRRDPNRVYGSLADTKGSGDIRFGASWGILSPLEPWAGVAAQTPTTGIVNSVQAVRPWGPTIGNQQVFKNSKDPSVVAPPAYEPATFGNYDVKSASGFAGLDPGYGYFRVMADVNTDGRADYCRFVGNVGQERLSCALAKSDGTFGNYDFNSGSGLAGLDPGYAYFRVMADVNADGRADYCRFVGNPGQERLACALAVGTGTFGNYDVQSASGFAGLDPGYPSFRFMADVNGDRRADYCRLVGNAGQEFLSCALAKADHTFGNYDVNSAPEFAGLDLGYGYFRVMADVNGDGRADYCRFVGNSGQERLSCALAKADGTFGNYDVNSAPGSAGLDPGYAYFRLMADVNGDGRADYCRVVGNVGQERLSCALAKSDGTFGNYDVNSNGRPQSPLDLGWPSFPRFMADVNTDHRADYCRFVGNVGREFLSCGEAK